MLLMAAKNERPWDDLSSKEKLGKRVKSLRAATGLSQEQLAVALGISMVKVQRIERGEASLAFPEIEKTCQLFSIRFEELMDPEFSIDPAAMRPFVLLVIGKPSKQLAERAQALIADLNDDHIARAHARPTQPTVARERQPQRPHREK